MVKLYVANCTKQDTDFLYRIPETQQVHRQHIKVGHQVLIYKDTTSDVIQNIIDQHQVYGMVAVEDVDRSKHFVGTCYQIGKPIEMGRVQYAIQHNDETRTIQANEAMAATLAARNNATEEELRGSGTTLDSLKMTIEEELKPDQSDGLSQTLSIDKEQASALRTSRGRR